jgi:hypothetical protein
MSGQRVSLLMKSIHQEINLNERWWYQNSDMKDLHQLFDQQLLSEKNHD